MKQLLPIICFAMLSVTLLADFPVHSNVSTVNVAKVTGGFDSFKWSWVTYNSQTATVYVVNGATAVDLTGYGLSLKLATQTPSGMSTFILTTNITILTNSATFGIAATNVPAPGAYQAEMLGWQGSTNLTRSLFQGMITVTKSLFDN